MRAESSTWTRSKCEWESSEALNSPCADHRDDGRTGSLRAEAPDDEGEVVHEPIGAEGGVADVKFLDAYEVEQEYSRDVGQDFEAVLTPKCQCDLLGAERSRA